MCVHSLLIDLLAWAEEKGMVSPTLLPLFVRLLNFF